MNALMEFLTRDSPRATLDQAALELASVEHPGLDPEPWLKELDRLALGVADRAGNLENGFDFLRAANHYLFEELGFHGNETYYYDPRNSCLNDVLAYRTGIPISLSLVYIEIARRLAKPVYGIGAPGHFLVQFDDGRVSVFIDPFRGGRVLAREQCLEALREYTGLAVDGSALARATPKQMLIRMLANLEGAYIRLKNFDKALKVADILRTAVQAPPRKFPGWPSAIN